jgi:hypothetical protein
LHLAGVGYGRFIPTSVYFNISLYEGITISCKLCRRIQICGLFMVLSWRTCSAIGACVLSRKTLRRKFVYANPLSHPTSPRQINSTTTYLQYPHYAQNVHHPPCRTQCPPLYTRILHNPPRVASPHVHHWASRHGARRSDSLQRSHAGQICDWQQLWKGRR